jgi:rod shape-determining protein MreC
MIRIKLWLIIFSVFLILLDKFSFISGARDSVAIYIQKHTELIIYKIKNYPKFVLLQVDEQHELEKENNQLKKQIEQYAILLKQQNNLEVNTHELEALRQQSNLYDGFKIAIARAIIDLNYLIHNKLLIDKGANADITTGNAVVNKDGIVGQIGIVNNQNAQVTLITNPDFKIYVQTQSSKAKMLAQGIGNNKIMVKYIKKTESIKEGDILVTTGLDDTYPANIPVAKIDKIFYENNGFNSALCEPIVDFNILKYVLVMKNAD